MRREQINSGVLQSTGSACKISQTDAPEVAIASGPCSVSQLDAMIPRHQNPSQKLHVHCTILKQMTESGPHTNFPAKEEEKWESEILRPALLTADQNLINYWTHNILPQEHALPQEQHCTGCAAQERSKPKQVLFEV